VAERGLRSGAREPVLVGERADDARHVRACRRMSSVNDSISIVKLEEGDAPWLVQVVTAQEDEEDRVSKRSGTSSRGTRRRTRVAVGHRRVVAVVVVADKVVAERDVAAGPKAAAEDRVGVVDARVEDGNLRASTSQGQRATSELRSKGEGRTLTPAPRTPELCRPSMPVSTCG